MRWGESLSCHQNKVEEKKEEKKKGKLALCGESHAVAWGSTAFTHPSLVNSGALTPLRRCLRASVRACLPACLTATPIAATDEGKCRTSDS